MKTETFEVLKFDPLNLEFHFRINNISDLEDRLQNRIEIFADYLGRPELKGTLFAVIQEMAVNGLKAIYRKIFHSHLLSEIGLIEATERDWNKLFLTELTSNRSDNFVRICKQNNLYVNVHGFVHEDVFRIEVMNPGIPGNYEHERLEKAFSLAKDNSDISFIFLQTEAADEGEAGIGIPFIINTLRGMRIPVDNFTIRIRESHTVARLDIPLRMFKVEHKGEVGLIPEIERKGILSRLISVLDFAVVIFNFEGKITRVSENLLDTLRIPARNRELINEIVPGKLYSDLFFGSGSVHIKGHFENYRLWITGPDRSRRHLFNISGFEDKEEVVTLWQPVVLEELGDTLSEGSIIENLNVQKLIKPYIPGQVLAKAHETVHQGKGVIPDEISEVTLLFADMVGYTRMTETTDPHTALGVLNMALSEITRNIERHEGVIDKFMGDAVFAIFDDPLEAVVAAMECQIQFQKLNEFRITAEDPPLKFRIGIHTGTIIMASVGTKERKDYTPIGDAVNTASRIEKFTSPGDILISEVTYYRIKDHIKVGNPLHIRVKGKEEELTLFTVKAIDYFDGEKSYYLALD